MIPVFAVAGHLSCKFLLSLASKPHTHMWRELLGTVHNNTKLSATIDTFFNGKCKY